MKIIFNTNKGQIYHGDVLETIRNIENESVNCVITSPPYWQLRDYGFPEQWGLESTFEEYLEHLWSLMDEIKRVLTPDGTVWINLGDTYGTRSGDMANKNKTNLKNKKHLDSIIKQSKTIDKCLLLIPHRFAIGCIDRGWIIRNDLSQIQA